MPNFDAEITPEGSGSVSSLSNARLDTASSEAQTSQTSPRRTPIEGLIPIPPVTWSRQELPSPPVQEAWGNGDHAENIAALPPGVRRAKGRAVMTSRMRRVSQISSGVSALKRPIIVKDQRDPGTKLAEMFENGDERVMTKLTNSSAPSELQGDVRAQVQYKSNATIFKSRRNAGQASAIMFYVLVAGLVPMVVLNEVVWVYGVGTSTGLVLNILISIDCIASVWALLRFHTANFKLLAQKNNYQVESSYWYSQKLPFVVVEIFIVAFHIPPGVSTNMFTIPDVMDATGEETYDIPLVHLNVFMFFRIALLGRFLTFVLWRSSYSVFLAALNKVELDFWFSFKAMVVKRPLGVMTLGLLMVVVVNSYCFSVFERYAKTEHFSSNAIWLVIATITTTGYGDVFARTDLGRLFLGILSLCSVVLTAGLTAMVFNSLSLSMSENKYVRTLQKADRQAALKQMAARAIQACWQRHEVTKKRGSSELIDTDELRAAVINSSNVDSPKPRPMRSHTFRFHRAAHKTAEPMPRKWQKAMRLWRQAKDLSKVETEEKNSSIVMLEALHQVSEHVLELRGQLASVTNELERLAHTAALANMTSPRDAERSPTMSSSNC